MAIHRRRAQLSGADDWGAKLWEWLNPAQVRAEYEMQGKVPPPDVEFSDVMERARDQAIDAAAAAHEHLTTGGEFLKKALIIGAVLYAGHLIVTLMSKRRGK